MIPHTWTGRGRGRAGRGGKRARGQQQQYSREERKGGKRKGGIALCRSSEEEVFPHWVSQSVVDRREEGKQQQQLKWEKKILCLPKESD